MILIQYFIQVICDVDIGSFSKNVSEVDVRRDKKDECMDLFSSRMPQYLFLIKTRDVTPVR